MAGGLQKVDAQYPRLVRYPAIAGTGYGGYTHARRRNHAQAAVYVAGGSLIIVGSRKELRMDLGKVRTGALRELGLLRLPKKGGAPRGPSVAATQQGMAFNPSQAQPGTLMRGINPRTLQASRRNLVSGRLAVQRGLVRANTPRHTPIRVTKDGVIYDGHHGARAAAEAGKPVDVFVVNESAQGHGPVLDLPVTER